MRILFYMAVGYNRESSFQLRKGKLEMKLTGVTADGTPLFVLEAETEIVTQDILYLWLVFFQALLNCILAIGSVITLIVITRKRYEGFSIWTLLIILVTSTILTTVQIYWFADRLFVFTEYCMAFLAMSAKLYAVQHFTFALQYLRASLTVPLHFERRMRLDSNRLNHLPVLDRKIVLIQRLILAAQIFIAVCIIPFGVFNLYND